MQNIVSHDLQTFIDQGTAVAQSLSALSPVVSHQYSRCEFLLPTCLTVSGDVIQQPADCRWYFS